MDSIQIIGGQSLQGEISIQGSKNATLPMMAAALLNKGISILHNCPKITDVFDMIKILEQLGVKTNWKQDSLYIDSSEIHSNVISTEYATKMRACVVLMGSLLARTNQVTMPYPGGCVIGKRPIDQHIYMLERFGVKIQEDEEFLYARCEELEGNVIHFAKKSVGATEHAVMIATLAKGVTRIENCAKEPEIIALCQMLSAMGADIKGAGTSELIIRGVTQLHDVEIEVPADRIVAGTYLLAGAISRGNITFIHFPVQELTSLLQVYEKMGGQYEVRSGKLTTCSKNIKYPIEYLETQEYPGFPTDLQSPLMAVLMTLDGESSIRETIFDDRFHVVSQFLKLGADIQIEGNLARVKGKQHLIANQVYAEDLRGGAALILAALYAKGETIVENYHFIERGYATICEDLNALGGILRIR